MAANDAPVEPWAVLVCSWCGEGDAVGIDQYSLAPTCERCSMLRTVRPWGWRPR